MSVVFVSNFIVYLLKEYTIRLDTSFRIHLNLNTLNGDTTNYSVILLKRIIYQKSTLLSHSSTNLLVTGPMYQIQFSICLTDSLLTFQRILT